MNFYGTFVFLSFVILIVIVVRSINSLLRKGITPGAKKKKKVSTLLLYPLFLILFFTWIFELIRIAFQFPDIVLPQQISMPVYQSTVLKIAGIIVIILALYLLKVALAHFGSSLRFGLDKNNHGKLVTTGIFSVSRNPFFLSLDIYFLGIALILPSFFFIGFFLLAFTGIHFFILKEEKFMKNVYGTEYEEYRKKVKRYI